MSYFQSCQKDMSIHTGYHLKISLVKFCERLQGVREGEMFIIRFFLIQSCA